MHDNLGHHASKKISTQAKSKLKVCPIMSIFEDLQGISLKVHRRVKVHLMEGLHGNLVFAIIFRSILFIVELQVMLYRTPRISSLLIFPRRYSRRNSPENDKYRYASEYGEENPREKAPANLQGEVGGYDSYEEEKEEVGETFTSCYVGRERCILDRGILRR